MVVFSDVGTLLSGSHADGNVCVLLLISFHLVLRHQQEVACVGGLAAHSSNIWKGAFQLLLFFFPSW